MQTNIYSIKDLKEIKITNEKNSNKIKYSEINPKNIIIV